MLLISKTIKKVTGDNIKREYKITEKYNPKEKEIDKKLQEVFIEYLTEKLTKTEKYIDKIPKQLYNHSSWNKGEFIVIGKGKK